MLMVSSGYMNIFPILEITFNLYSLYPLNMFEHEEEIWARWPMSPFSLDTSGLTYVRRDDTRVFAQRMLQDVEQMLRVRCGGLG